MKKYAELIAALKRAQVKAKEAGLLSDDGGTCNFDSPVLYMPKGTREATMKKIGGAAGVRFFKLYNTAGGAWWTVHGDFISGQANRRTASAEAFAASLKADGFESDTYYQID